MQTIYYIICEIERAGGGRKGNEKEKCKWRDRMKKKA